MSIEVHTISRFSEGEGEGGFGTVGHTIEQIWVRDGTEVPFKLPKAMNCGVSPHIIPKGSLAYSLPKGLVACTDHISSVMTQQEFIEYQVAQNQDTRP